MRPALVLSLVFAAVLTACGAQAGPDFNLKVVAHPDGIVSAAWAPPGDVEIKSVKLRVLEYGVPRGEIPIDEKKLAWRSTRRVPVAEGIGLRAWNDWGELGAGVLTPRSEYRLEFVFRYTEAASPNELRTTVSRTVATLGVEPDRGGLWGDFKIVLIALGAVLGVGIGVPMLFLLRYALMVTPDIVAVMREGASIRAAIIRYCGEEGHSGLIKCVCFCRLFLAAETIKLPALLSVTLPEDEKKTCQAIQEQLMKMRLSDWPLDRAALAKSLSRPTPA